MKCYVCDSVLGPQNETEEHIIINAAGGRLKSKNLICIDCNNRFGQQIDKILADQVNTMANMLMVKRHRGEPQPIVGKAEKSGAEYKVHVGGTPEYTKPTFDKRIEGDETKYSIRARTESEMRTMLTGLKKKHPQLDVEEALRQATRTSKRMDEAIGVSIEVGGDDVFRAVCKCAVNFFIHNGGRAAQIKHLIPFIEGKEKMNVVWMHYQEGLYDLSVDESFHLLHLVGNGTDHTLYCYVDYFNTYRYLVLMNDNYTGVDINTSYCFDLLEIKQLERSLNVIYDRKTLLNFFENRDVNLDAKVKAAFDHALAIGMRRQSGYQTDLLVKRAIQLAFSRYPHNALLDESMIEQIVTEVVNAVIPMLPPNEEAENL